MKIIGLCGGSGSGKSTIADCLAKMGAEVIDADKIARSLTETDTPVLENIRTAFGEGVFTSHGKLNRGALASIVFSHPAELKKLNEIIHPEISKQIQKRLNNCQTTAIIDAAVLHQAGLDTLCDKRVFVTAPKEIRVERIMKRDGISKEAAENRINAQPTDQEYETVTDVTVFNDGTKTIREIAETILQGVM